jgi:hypothetical protein
VSDSTTPIELPFQDSPRVQDNFETGEATSIGIVRPEPSPEDLLKAQKIVEELFG